MKDGEREGERERALRMGVGYYRARNHQSLRGPAEEEERGGRAAIQSRLAGRLTAMIV